MQRLFSNEVIAVSIPLGWKEAGGVHLRGSVENQRSKNFLEFMRVTLVRTPCNGGFGVLSDHLFVDSLVLSSAEPSIRIRGHQPNGLSTVCRGHRVRDSKALPGTRLCGSNWRNKWKKETGGPGDVLGHHTSSLETDTLESHDAE